MSEEQPVARERSGHTAAADGQYLYVWGGYVVIIIIIFHETVVYYVPFCSNKDGV